MGYTSAMEPGASRTHQIGLCCDCVHARVIRSDRGSEFYQCRLAATNARYPKYPRLPVIRCDGYLNGTLGSQ